VLGEADFSWSHSLVGAGSGPDAEPGKSRKRLTATSFDDADALRAKYSGVDDHVAALGNCGAKVLHGIDATSLGGYPSLVKRGPFDLIVFHFPHVGGDDGLASSIKQNSALLRGFLTSAAPLLADGGECHMTLVHRYPYTAWLHGVRRSEEPADGKAGRSKRRRGVDDDSSTPLRGLEYVGSAPFDAKEYDGYHHQATTRIEAGVALDVVSRCLTHAWRRSDAAGAGPSTEADAAGSGGGAAASPTGPAGSAGGGKRKRKKKTSEARAERRRSLRAEWEARQGEGEGAPAGPAAAAAAGEPASQTGRGEEKRGARESREGESKEERRARKKQRRASSA